MKRQRGRGRKPGGGGHHNHQGGGHPNRTMESNGPDTKVRGPASHIYERYLQLARDAASSGDRVLSENYMQHADHYFRLVRQMQPAAPPPPERFANEPELDGEEEAGGEAEGAEEAAAADGGDQPDVEFPQGQPQQFERGEGEGRRRRGRRNRFRPGGGEGEGEGGDERRAEGGEGRRERGEGEGRRERGEGEGRRERRERDGEQAGPEGFSNGPRPAFLRGD